ncbi:MAG: glycosyl transferase family 2, partial [Acidobacteria bacterium]
MLHGKKIVVVMPAYNAAATLRRTYSEIPFDVVDEVVLVDDASRDGTVAIAKELNIRYIVHPKNAGYGANQKTCYREALRAGADIVVMVHPDYQYTPKLITAMAAMITSGIYHAVLGSRV